MDVDTAARHLPPMDQHSPSSSSSVASDKENSRDMLMTQRVRSIVSEFNKIANECDAVTTRQTFSRRNPTNQSLNFHRQGFRNASMHVIPTGMRPTANYYNKASSDSLNSFLLDNFNAAKPAKLDHLTALQAACERKETDEEVDKSDFFALQSQHIRLQNRYADLAKLRSDASAATGGKRSAIIDKKARQCLNDADQRLGNLRERIDHLGVLLEQHRHFEKLCDELDKWISDLHRNIQKDAPNQNLQSICAQMQNERANFEELRKLSEALGIQQQKQFEQVVAKWTQVEERLALLNKETGRVDANVKLNQAIEQLTDFLGKTYDLNTSAQLRKQLECIEQLETLCQENIKQTKVNELKKDEWTEPMTPRAAKPIPIYDDCTQSISTSPSSDHSIPISSFTSSQAQIHTEPMELHAFLNSLQNYNCVRFAAYRTGMKLFAVQKRLCLDLVEISELDREFKFLPAGIAQIPWESLFTVLRRIYESAHVNYPRSVPDVQHAIHRCVEWLRLLIPNFDTRTVMLILIVLSNGSLDDKYRYLFMVYSNDNVATAADLRLLFGDLAKLPALLQEGRTFGAANVESTICSCLRASTYIHTHPNDIHSNGVHVLPVQNSSLATHIKSNDFCRWIRQDPQTLVWIRVMHRLVRSEFAKHNVRCAGCKIGPIVGIRFRCLHCFNVDLCQNCFFTQRAVKGHKLKHEMHEYYTPTSTLDNMRDFSQILHNKMRRTRSSNKIGYTPIDLNLTVAQAENSQQPTDKSFTDGHPGIEINVDAVIEKARREGRLPPPRPPQRCPAPLSTRQPSLSNQKPTALSLAASPEDLNRLILELKQENSALWQAFGKRQQLNESIGEETNMPVVDRNAPPLLRRFDSSTRELAEAMNCLLALSDPTNV